MITALCEDCALDRYFRKDIMLVFSIEVVAHWVADVLPESCAPVVEESVTHRANTLADISSTAKSTCNLVHHIIGSTRATEA